MSDTQTDEINLLLENLDEWIDDSLENSKPIGLTLCSARRTIVGQRDRITELWDALGMVSRQRDRMEEELNDAWKERDQARRELAETISCIEQAIDFHQVHGQSIQASAIKNLLENINQRRKHE